MRWWLVALSIVAACGGEEDAPPDASVGPNRVTLSVDGAAYLKYRDADGPWQSPISLGGYDYALDVTDDYEVIVACGDADTFDNQLHAWTFDDGAEQYAFCSVGGQVPPPPPVVTVSGQMLQPGTVWMSASESGTTSPWSFALDMYAGTHDLFGVTSDRVLLRRDLSIADATTVPDVDVVTDGVALDQVPLTINGTQPGDQITSSIVWFTSNDLAEIDGTATTLLAPPAAIVEPSDGLVSSVEDVAGASHRYAGTLFTGAATTFDLMPVLTGITYAMNNGAISVSWDTLPDPFYDLSVDLLGSGGSIERDEITASKTWIDHTGARSLDFADLPAALATIDLDAPYVRDFTVFDFETPTVYETSLSEGVNGAPLRRPHSPADAPLRCGTIGARCAGRWSR